MEDFCDVIIPYMLLALGLPRLKYDAASRRKLIVFKLRHAKKGYFKSTFPECLRRSCILELVSLLAWRRADALRGFDFIGLFAQPAAKAMSKCLVYLHWGDVMSTRTCPNLAWDDCLPNHPTTDQPKGMVGGREGNKGTFPVTLQPFKPHCLPYIHY